MADAIVWNGHTLTAFSPRGRPGYECERPGWRISVAHLEDRWLAKIGLGDIEADGFGDHADSPTIALDLALAQIEEFAADVNRVVAQIKGAL
jgi:hypothetical protein